MGKVCIFDHLKLLIFLESIMSRNELIKQIFLSDNADMTSIEYAVNKSQPSILKYLLDMKEVQDRYKNNDPMIFRLCFHLFVLNSNSELTDYVLSALEVSKQKVVQMLSYKCPKQPGYKQGGS